MSPMDGRYNILISLLFFTGYDIHYIDWLVNEK